MPDEHTPCDPRQEYAALLRAVAARIELEQSFGIESGKLPAFLPLSPVPQRPHGAPHPPPQRPMQPAAQMPAPPKPQVPNQQAVTPQDQSQPPKAAPKPEPVARVVSETRSSLLDSGDYDIRIPEGLSKQEQLDYLARSIAGCTLCPLHKQRTQVVFGVGTPDAELMFIGEAPGKDEDEQGEPFVGRAGQLLTKIIEAINFKREEVYIANINKCRPPENRAPAPDEMARCRPFLLRQIDIIRPKVICLLGATAVRGLLQISDGITKIRGRFMAWHDTLVMPTFHPAYLLRNPAGKREVWEDVQKVRDAVRGQK